ncbi:AAA family ATPase [Streptomyces sp. bgisy060]|uniref:AAA family ATPase n=1 Tax=Streptomyces sp. bgisy060 TaxID=3413775 RepID=UPI003EB7A403
MITKISIDGFKSFRNFELDLAPCTVLTGRASAGRSNMFDALTLVARALLHDFDSAVALTPRLAPVGLFHQATAMDGRTLTADQFRISVGMVIGGSTTVVDLVAQRRMSSGGVAAVLDQDASGIRVGGGCKMPFSGGVPAEVLEEVIGWATPVPLDATGSRVRDADDVRRRVLLSDLAALVDGFLDVRADEHAVEIHMRHRGWVPVELLPNSALRTLSVLAAAHGGSSNVLLLDNLEESLAPSVAAELARRFARRHSAGGPQLIVSTYALPVIEALETGCNAEVVVIDTATRIEPQSQSSTVSVARRVRDVYP